MHCAPRWSYVSIIVCSLTLLLFNARIGWTQLAPATQPSAVSQPSQTERLAHIHVNVKAKRIDVDCEALNVTLPLEFFCVTDGGNEHESVLRTPARPSDIHFALLMLGLTPGAPATFVPSRRLWLPPHGPPLRITCTFLRKGKPITVPACSMMRSIADKKEMPPSIWVFDGSRVMPDGVYAADITGYVVSICNFDLTMIDVPAMVSNSNDTLEWEFNPDVVPTKGTPVTMTIESLGGGDTATRADYGGVPADKFYGGPGLTEESDAPTSRP
jgi:hypothetical protein